MQPIVSRRPRPISLEKDMDLRWWNIAPSYLPPIRWPCERSSQRGFLPIEIQPTLDRRFGIGGHRIFPSSTPPCALFPSHEVGSMTIFLFGEENPAEAKTGSSTPPLGLRRLRRRLQLRPRAVDCSPRITPQTVWPLR
jgi:hypothetical protein